MRVMTHCWHAILAGGIPKTAWVAGAWLVPMFASHNDCVLWWTKFCQDNRSVDTPWGITDRMPEQSEVQP